ncbi:MAG: aspartyl/glutamyl-tRNA amidotransferase subunit C [Planctomycetaceae bacterium]|nr:aspartyl/glutamyl-tRNA amidotransferase subunit C [Planctomycetaceae bacterium]
MSFTAKEVQQAAFQVRFLFDEKELQAATDAVNASLERTGMFDEVTTDHIEPLFFGNAKQNVFREDAVGTSLSMDATMQNAPKHDGDCFLFPAVLG